MKQAIIVRTDISLTPGKLAAQVAHASVSAIMKNPLNNRVAIWLIDGQSKIVLQAKDVNELSDLFNKAKSKGLITSMILDAGRTEVEEGTITCIAIGPDEDNKVDKITGSLKLL